VPTTVAVTVTSAAPRSAATGPGPLDASSPAPTLAQLIGAKMAVGMDGTIPTASLLGRIRRGEVGGVILFARNFRSRAALLSVTAALQAAARAGGQPPVLVMTDQEGGALRQVWWAAPTPSARSMGYATSATIRSLGAATGSALHAVGITLDLAPVADVPSSHASFMWMAGRTFSLSPSAIGRDILAFASGLVSRGVGATAKHFPGIGRAVATTDRFVVTIRASLAALAADLAPFRAAIAAGIPFIMLSNATYPAWDSSNAAGWSRRIAVTLLRGQLGFRGVSITDSLDGTAASRGLQEWQLALKAAQAGTDMLLVTGCEATTAATYARLLAAAQAGQIDLGLLRASYDRIRAARLRFGA
jgi:beta-N-acetylhexosaminidase